MPDDACLPSAPTLPRKLTIRQKILAAAIALPSDASGFPIDDLVVRAWEMFPDTFSLRGYFAKYPDSNRVQAKLCGKDGLVGFGFLDQPAQRMYRVTQKGRREAARFLKGVALDEPATVDAATFAAERPAKPPRPSRRKRTPKPLRLDDSDVKALDRLVKSDAFRKFSRGVAVELADANRFWHPRDVTAASALLERVLAHFADDVTPDPRLPPVSTCYGLLNLHRMMATKFGAR